MFLKDGSIHWEAMIGVANLAKLIKTPINHLRRK
jgi:hypothetical protein